MNRRFDALDRTGLVDRIEALEAEVRELFDERNRLRAENAALTTRHDSQRQVTLPAETYERSGGHGGPLQLSLSRRAAVQLRQQADLRLCDESDGRL